MKGQNPAVSGAMDGRANEVKRTCLFLLGATNFILDKSEMDFKMSTQTLDLKTRDRLKRRLDLLRGVFKRLIRTEPPLQSKILYDYLGRLLSKKQIFMESAARFGTPQYFFDEPSLVLQIKRFRKTYSAYFDRYRAFYAMKSNSFEGISEQIVSQGMGLDVSSGFELTRALSLDCPDIIFSGPGKTGEELLLAFKNRNRVTLLLDSAGELQRLREVISLETPSDPPLKLGIRVRSDGQGIWNKFGVPLKDLVPLYMTTRTFDGVKPCGIQFHTSWNLDPAPQIRMIVEISDHILRHMPRDLLDSLKFIDIGGGFWPEQGEWLNPQNTLRGEIFRRLAPDYCFRSGRYHRKAQPLRYFAKAIAMALKQQGPPLSHLEIWIEPGRWLSTPAMHILVRVLDKKDAATLITDGGTNLLGWERPLTEFIPIVNLTKPGLKEKGMNIFGSLCTPHDIWGTSVFGEGAEPGDVLLVPDQGAYTYSLRQSFIKPPADIIRFDGQELTLLTNFN